ncbi:hypothetical protein AGR4B_pAt20465 [Agrobacterium tumefaciens str. CFBP 5621]|nr:hypothetical protein AGR4B_pAt20465 [Agrobacterium tumefaciens str. CFBP 5621]
MSEASQQIEAMLLLMNTNPRCTEG